MKLANNYVLISPCRDEADYMRQTLDSIVAQSVRPAKWVIVDDGSTDKRNMPAGMNGSKS
jgi:biofilm PGA synthesis N-glycosyltransferase PgaC